MASMTQKCGSFRTSNGCLREEANLPMPLPPPIPQAKSMPLGYLLQRKPAFLQRTQHGLGA